LLRTISPGALVGCDAVQAAVVGRFVNNVAIAVAAKRRCSCSANCAILIGRLELGFDKWVFMISARTGPSALKGAFPMPSNSSDPRRPQDKDAGTRTRLTSEANGSSGVLHRAIPANDNVADGSRPTNVAQEETFAWLRPSREEIAISSGDVAKGKAITIAYALGVVLVMLAWFYLLSFHTMWTTEWL
jgi:hypothetical protein